MSKGSLWQRSPYSLLVAHYSHAALGPSPRADRPRPRPDVQLRLQPVKHGFLDHATVPEVLDDDALEQLGGHARVPDALRVDDDDGTAGADSQTGRLAALHPARPEEQVLALKQLGEQAVECPAAPRSAPPPGAWLRRLQRLAGTDARRPPRRHERGHERHGEQ